jgi:anti-sigma-K factor RskA
MTDRFIDDAPAYALGALAADEAAVFEAHLQSCDACRAEVASYGPVMRQLASYHVPAPAAPPRVGPRAQRRPAWLLPFAASIAISAAGSYAGGFLHARSDDAAAMAVAGMIAGATEDVHTERGGMHLRVLVGMHRERTAFVVAGLPEPHAGRVYQVWVNGRSAGLLQRMPAGEELLVVSGDRLHDAHRIGVSDEPAGGSPIRTTPSLIAFDARG